MDKMENNIEKLTQEIDTYKEAIREAREALAAAEQELDEELEYQLNSANAADAESKETLKARLSVIRGAVE